MFSICNKSGFLLLNKPIFLSSNKVLEYIKRKFYVKKIGHTGTLDPLAVGLLPICFGKATKFSKYFLDYDKTYEVIMCLGISTSTGDIFGNIINVNYIKFKISNIKKKLKEFYGEVLQTPHIYSAVKFLGNPLYKYSRLGFPVSSIIRKIIIYKFKSIKYSSPYIKFIVKCSKGTYIRTLVEDIGNSLGCGACVFYIKRIKVGFFSLKNSINLQFLKRENIVKYILRIDILFKYFSCIYISDFDSVFFLNGNKIKIYNNYYNKFNINLITVYKLDKYVFLGLAKIYKNFLIPSIIY